MTTIDMTLQETARKPIRLLPAHLINRIAAGEVVERPASVVKEMVENALDAGATRIEIVASSGGRMLRISDNGYGMGPEDAKLAFYNHATSKIQSDDDLHRIQTLGFRGEALASIASISNLTCLTRTSDALTGLRVLFDATSETPTEPIITEAGCAPGTVMEVADLFYNTPARLKFLKRPKTEMGHIEETVETLSLSHPNVRFRLVGDDKVLIDTKGDGDLKQTISDIFKLHKDPIELIEIDYKDPDAGYAIHGYTSAPGVMKNSKRWLVTFTNGRTVKCHLLQKAIETAYESLLPHGRYPLCVFNVTLPIDELDVNVHPTKKEVRYANTQSVFSFVQVAVKRALEHYVKTHYTSYHFTPEIPAQETPVVASEMSAPSNYSFPSSGALEPRQHHPVEASRWSYRDTTQASVQQHRMSVDDALYLQSPLQSPLQALGSIPDMAVGTDSSSSDVPVLPQYKVLGQLFNTYILLETAQGLMVVDQHIASERELFESISNSMMSETPPTQQWLAASPISISPLQADLLKRHEETFTKLGFAFQVHDEASSLQITGIPLIYQDRTPNKQPITLFENMLAQLEETGDAQLMLDHAVNNLIATLACHTAVRAGDPLSHTDMERVISGWLVSKLPWTCPHGRPIAHTINKEELNKFFHRPSLPVNSL